jgi:hypothetical protein
MFNKKLLLVSLFIFALSFTLSAFAQEPDGLRLVFKGKAGDINEYKVEMTGNSTVAAKGESKSTDMNMNMVIRQKIMNISEDGTQDVSTTITNGQTFMGGQPVELPNVGTSLLMKITDRGKVLNVTGKGPDDIDFKQMQVEFPAKKLKVGDSWTRRLKATAKFPVPMIAKYFIKGFSKVKGYDCVIIDSTIGVDPNYVNEEKMELAVDASGKLYFAYKEGKMVKNEVKTLMDLTMKLETPEQPEPVKINMKMDLNMSMVIQ